MDAIISGCDDGKTRWKGVPSIDLYDLESRALKPNHFCRVYCRH